MKLIVLFITLIILNAHSTPLSDPYLPEDDVEILNIEKFGKFVVNSTNAWLVTFYSSWQENSHTFSEPWKKFATEIASWRDVVRVGVLACSDEANTPICNAYKFPTVRYFRKNYTVGSGDLGVLIPHESDDTVEMLKKIVIQTFITETKEGRGLMYPNLLPYTHSDVSELFTDVNGDVQFVFLIVEEPGGYLGAEVALDLHRTPNITIRYSFDDNTDLINKLQIENFPSLVVVDRKNNTEIFTKSVSTKREMKAAIGTYLQEKGIQIVEIVPNKIQNSVLLHIKNMGDVIFQVDLEAALQYSLEREVSRVKLIKDEKLDALNAYVKVIQKYFPFGYNNTYFIDKLSNLTSKSEKVEGAQILLLIREAKENVTFSSPRRFLGCLGSSPRYRGYPCSLWRLFHFLTVNSLLYNVNKTKANPTEVLDAVHGYIKNFFACEQCSRNFQEMAVKRNLTGVETLEESVFWLWEAHNEVNARLKGDFTEDPEYPKNQFPTKCNCPECYDGDGSWKKGKVLKYLKRMYGKYSVRYIGSDTKVLFPGLD